MSEDRRWRRQRMGKAAIRNRKENKQAIFPSKSAE